MIRRSLNASAVPEYAALSRSELIMYNEKDPEWNMRDHPRFIAVVKRTGQCRFNMADKFVLDTR